MEKSRKTKHILLVSISIFLLILVIGASYFLLSGLELVIELKGEDTITIPYGERFQDPGAGVYLKGSPLLNEPAEMELQVQSQGQVPENQVGTFSITYQAEKLWLHGQAQRTVIVEDLVPPVITLVSEKEPEPGVPYVEEGYTASDNADGDLTDQVIRKEYEGEVHYTVKDSSGNETTVIRKVTTFDITPPEITLLGQDKMELPYGNPWEEPGFQAQDAMDGDLTELVTVEGSVDPWLPGDYTLTYTAMDKSENMAICTRTVTVSAAPRKEVVWPQGKTIYLTFDDGPGQYTDYLLDILKKHNVKATFFVVGAGHGREMRRIVEEGHSIAVHSITHNYKQIYAGEDAFFADLLGMQKIIQDHTGYKTTLMRFPGGGSNLVSSFNKGIMTTLTEAVQDAGFQYFDWNVDSNDAGGARTWEEVYKNVTEGCSRQRVSVVLQHDIHPFSVQAVESIILWGKKNGYQFLPLEPNSYGAHHSVLN